MATLDVARVAGGYLGTARPVFTRDRRFVFLSCDTVVKLVSVATGLTVRELRGHTGIVTAMVLNPANHLQLYTASADGSVCLFDYDEAVLLKVPTEWARDPRRRSSPPSFLSCHSASR